MVSALARVDGNVGTTAHTHLLEIEAKWSYANLKETNMRNVCTSRREGHCTCDCTRGVVRADSKAKYRFAWRGSGPVHQRIRVE